MCPCRSLRQVLHQDTDRYFCLISTLLSVCGLASQLKQTHFGRRRKREKEKRDKGNRRQKRTGSSEKTKKENTKYLKKKNKKGQ